MKQQIEVKGRLVEFECEDCGKVFTNYKNAQAVAAKHAKTYGHKVVGEVGLSVEYDGRE